MNNLKAAPWNPNPSTSQPPGIQCRCRRNICVEVDWFESILKHDTTRSVLSVTSGVSRHTAELTRRGYRVTSIDLSSSLPPFRRSRDTDAANGGEVIWTEIDKLHLDQLAANDLCISTGVFSKLQRDDQDLFLLRQLSRSLKPGGHLVLTAANAAYILAHKPHKLNPLTRRGQLAANEIASTGIADPTLIEQRWYTTLEINWLLNRVGMCPQRYFGVNHNGFVCSEELDNDCEAFGVLAVKTVE